MNKEKILVYTDNGRAADFEKDINEVIERANNLLNAWHKFQYWHKVKTSDEAYAIIKDPAGAMDAILLNSIDLKVAGGTKVNVEVIANMLNCDRDNWRAFIQGMPVYNCQVCDGLKIGRRAISLNELEQYNEYIKWNRLFIADDQAIELKKQSFKTYAETPQQLKLYNHFTSLKDELTEHIKLGLIGPDRLKQITDALNLRYVGNVIYLNDEYLNNLILKA